MHTCKYKYPLWTDKLDLLIFNRQWQPILLSILRSKFNNCIWFFHSIGDKETIELLLQKGADINAKANDYWTTLHVAAFTGIHISTAAILSEMNRITLRYLQAKRNLSNIFSKKALILIKRRRMDGHRSIWQLQRVKIHQIQYECITILISALFADYTPIPNKLILIRGCFRFH